MSLRDARAFRVLKGLVYVTTHDEDLERIYRGDRIGAAVESERYDEGDTVPAGRMPARSVDVLEGKGVIEAIEEAPAPDATDAARAAAAEASLDLALVTGTGSGGRVTLPDVQAYLAALGTGTGPAATDSQEATL